MRKILFIALAILFTLTSCLKEEPLGPASTTGRYAEGTATLDFTVITSESPVTKAAFAEDAKINSLYLVIFDEEGFVTQITEATLAEPGSIADNSNKRKYKATLALSYEHRTIHFLGNIQPTVMGTEEETIAALYTQNKYDSYWQRIEMPDGITVKADSNGDPLLDDGNMIFSDDVIDALKTIPLIRNYAKFTLTSTTEDLELVSACVVGTGNRGAVAPYNREESRFVSNYADYGTPEDLISSLNYNGCIPEGTEPTSFDDTWTSINGSSITLYSYERELPKSNPPFILLQAKYNGSTTPTFYKINLRDANNEYFPILRNYNYKINIHSVAKAGYPDAQSAIDGPGSGDISTDLDYLNLTNISNGEARIFVSYTERVLVTGNAVELKFKFIPDINNAPNVTDNDAVYFTRGESGYFGDIFGDDSDIVIKTGDDSDGYRTVLLSPADPDEYIKTQTVTITGKYKDAEDNDATISRIITFTLREKPEITLSCENTVNRTLGSAVPLDISIPGGLSESMFPLDILIEAEKNSLTPDASATDPVSKNLPVRSGKSLFDGSRPGFYYVRQITWDEYQSADNVGGIKTFQAAFKTNAAVSATAILARNEYFFDGMTYFKNTGDLNSFQALKFENPVGIGLGQATDFSFIATSADPVTVTLTNATWNNGTSDVSTFTITPTPFEPQTISGIKANSFGNAVTVSLSATGYTSESKLTKRFVTIPAGSVSGNYNPYGTDFGGDSEGTKTSDGILYAGLNTASALAEVPVSVTRTGTESILSAPKFTGTPTTTRGGSLGNRTYQFNFTISNFDSNIEYYWSTTNSSSAIPAENRITSASAGIPYQSSRDVYIWAKKDGQFSNSSYLRAKNDSGTNNVDNNNPGDDKTIYAYTYSFTGPTQATTIELDSDVQSTDKIYIYYDSSNYVELNLSDLNK